MAEAHVPVPAGEGDAGHELTAATEQHGAAHAEPTAFGIGAEGWVSWAMLAVFAFMIWKRVPAAIGRALDKRIASIRQQLDEAAQLRAEAEALRAEYEAKSAQADAEAATMIERARVEAEGIVRQAESDASDLVERRTRMAEDKIAAAERDAVDAIRAKAASVAATAAEQLIRDRLDAGADKAMVDATISELGRP